MDPKDKFLQLLAQDYPSRLAAAKEVVLLSSVLNLTKGAEIFLSDIHGEHEAFQHVLRNGSGVIKQKITEIYGAELEPDEINLLATLIYYPEEKLPLVRPTQGRRDFYKEKLFQLIKITTDFASIYASRKFGELLPLDLADLIQELVAQREIGEANDYYDHLIDSIIDVDQAERLIIEFSKLIQRLAIHKIHIIGDIYDRGPGAEIIMDELTRHHAVDFQWGNHDIVWMGASLGNEACIANVLRLSLRYANTSTLEKGYGINLIALASFAIEHYKEDQGIVFNPKVSSDELMNESERWLSKLMHKAISIIQFKLEGQLISRRPEFQMSSRLLLDKINYEVGAIEINGASYSLKDTFFPTIDPSDPYRLTEAEREVIAKVKVSFEKSERLQKHAQALFNKGGMYKVTNRNLLYHGCVPLTAEGRFHEVDLGRGPMKGRSYLDFFDQQMQIAFAVGSQTAEGQYAVDLTWYLWAGPYSPLFGKDKMATFERYFLDDEAVQREVKDPYYQFRDDEHTCLDILKEFGLDTGNCVILNGHVPVSVKKGESPIKANGKLIVIDGGFSKAYQDQTGIAGYTMIHNCFGRQLIAHQPFESRKEAIEAEVDIAGSETVLDQSTAKQKVRDLDDGRRLMSEIDDLKLLLRAYETGEIKEKIRQT
ncbi:MAG: fructose-1,6-bisphosphatase [Bacteroidota bacterium]